MARIFAGTSGYAYPSWKPAFYPATLPARKFLCHYARALNSVEINYTFHRLPSQATLQSWIESTPEQFRFSLKAHMRLTHLLRLKDAGEFLGVFFRAIDALRIAGRLGPVLFQLPPPLRCDSGLLRRFLADLPDDVPCAFEFRHASWLNEDVYAALRERGVALCLAESEQFETPRVLTADFVYVRLRKADYPAAERAQIRERARQLVASGKDVYVYFKHEETPAGTVWARELIA